jgi:hypothetical protein
MRHSFHPSSVDNPGDTGLQTRRLAALAYSEDQIQSFCFLRILVDRRPGVSTGFEVRRSTPNATDAAAWHRAVTRLSTAAAGFA